MSNLTKSDSKVKIYAMFGKAIVTTIVLAILGAIGFLGFTTYSYYFMAPTDSPKGQYVFKVNSGDNLSVVSKKLEQDKVIPSTEALVLQTKLNTLTPLQAGEYKLNLPATPEVVLSQLNQESIRISQLKKVETVQITFKEGETVDKMIERINNAGVAETKLLQDFARNPDSFNKQTYPFLPKPLNCTYGDLKNCAKYYIEGYLYPDTYEFTKPATPEKVFETMLTNFKNKVWTKLNIDATKVDFDKAIIMGSVLEKETGRTKGVTDDNKAELSQERKIMAGVFYNRLKAGMKWGSDVTAEYGTGRKLCQQTFAVENCMKLDSPLVNTKYNTYLITGYPIGPISSPQFDNIYAVINPDVNNYLYFVSDTTGKNYFSKTGAEHSKTIQEVGKINKDLG